MNKKEKFIYGFLGLWCFFATAIGSDYLLNQLFKILGIKPSTGLNFIFSIIIFGLLIDSFEKSNDEVKEKDKRTLISSIHFINCINNMDYSKLEFIKNIQLTELNLIRFTFKNSNQTTLEIDKINNIYVSEDIIKLDAYLKENCDLSDLENEQIKLHESSSLHMLINSYMNNR